MIQIISDYTLHGRTVDETRTNFEKRKRDTEIKKTKATTISKSQQEKKLKKIISGFGKISSIQEPMWTYKLLSVY